VIVAITGALCFSAATPASAAVVSAPLATGFAGPLSIAVGGDGNVYVGQSFSGVLTRVAPDGTRTDLFSAPGAGIEGVSVRGGKVTFTETVFPEEGPSTSGLLKRRFAGGFVKTLADLHAYEATSNPDQHQTYGFRFLSDDCAAQLPAEIGPAKYTGLVDSHPYGTAVLPNGDTYVAEAGGNAILRVSDDGHISTVAVLPAIPFLVTAEAAGGLGLPECTIGKRYWYEPVPTDVEVGRDGSLYVTSLPGGPEDPSLGARGSVMRIDPQSGHVRTIAKGFLGATNVAVSFGGKVFVAELFGGQVSTVSHGAAVPVAEIAEPAGLEWKQGKLFVSYDVFGAGAVATISP